VDEYFNGSTGNGNEGDQDMHGPWQTSFGLQPVESELHGGPGLSVDAIDGMIPGEDRGKQDAGKPATTAPAKGELVGASQS
jgi:Mn-containing catalase